MAGRCKEEGILLPQSILDYRVISGRSICRSTPSTGIRVGLPVKQGKMIYRSLIYVG